MSRRSARCRPAPPKALRVVVIGGGIIGLACADELARSGHDVRVCDPAPGSGATYAAAGMLAPAGEAWFGQEPLLRLGQDSLARWPGFAESLQERSGVDLELRATGTLLVAADRDDLAEVRRACDLLRRAGVRVDDLDRAALRAEEPALTSRVVGGAVLPDDQQVNPTLVTKALLTVLGDRVVRSAAEPAGLGVVLSDGAQLPADVVLLATGADRLPRVRPVRGEIIRVLAPDPPRRMIRARLHGEQVYVVPRRGGEVLIGATEQEHARGDPVPTVGGVARLLEAGRALLPGLDTAELLEITARDRPGSPDNGPVIGPVPADGPSRRLVAGGHYRGGVLLAPVTAAVVRAHVERLPVPDVARPFAPDRFAPDRFAPARPQQARAEIPCG